VATSVLRRPLDRSPLLRGLRGLYQRRLTARGRFVLWATLAVAFVGVDTRRALVFALFSLAAPPLLLAFARLFGGPPRLRLEGRLPERLTAGRTATARIVVAPRKGPASGPLSLFWGKALPADGLAVSPVELALDAPRDAPASLTVTLRALQRGRYLLPRLGAARSDLFGLARTKAVWLPETVVLAHPRHFTIETPPLPTGRRYQPGGIPLASALGDSTEFVGTREYRQGDPLRRIHWRSWARLGRPVVKEHQEEYFSRIALVLDTFLPRRPRPRERARFEAAISLLASVADGFGRSEEVVDVLAAGPDLYEVSTGRSLGTLDTVLDVLACLEPSSGPPFASITPALCERLERLTTVVAVLLEWDGHREAFVRRVRAMGVAVRVLLVHEGDTRRPFADVGADLAEIEQLTPAAIEARLAAEETLA
jgi:uncharacterized protein (DUF58 family)